MDSFSVQLWQKKQNIGLIIPDVVISEKHTDSLEITEHPVERPSKSGSGTIADHAFRKPAELIMEVGFAGGGSWLEHSPLNPWKSDAASRLSPAETFEKLVNLQRTRIPFDVTTSKRQYNNMLISTLSVTTDKNKENVLYATVTLREVIISDTTAAKTAPRESMKLGSETSAVQNAGTKTAKPVNNAAVHVSAR